MAITPLFIINFRFSIFTYYNVEKNQAALMSAPCIKKQANGFVKSVQSALSDLLTTSATHGTFSRPSTKRGLISIIKLMQFAIVHFF